MGKGSGGSGIKRGAFIVLEGCDRSGKSTQCRLLFQHLLSKGVQVKHMAFPARESNIGKVINSYLTNKQDLTDEGIHLLFSANRWEFKNEMKKLLESGTTLVVDRYSYSGVAYSVAKGLTYDWCMSPELGLLRPDAVFYLNAPVDMLSNRGSFGEERYEKKEFQLKVAKVFERIYAEQQSYWHSIDARLSQDEVTSQIIEKALKVLSEAHDKPLKVLQSDPVVC